ncbi:NAD(+)/NADH kinase [Candidatus Obscuribacterales bacterium]|nr:NAD(+)/NADH kinase [Candidatus Obscuribacterales bacterium]MBX3153742.1 NAD(+)/NADH kinase [Candidatus Obscuribacterales bacterium]
MRLKKALVLHKKSIYQIQAEEFKDERFLQLLKEGHESVRKVKLAHEEHIAALDTVKDELARRNIEFQSVARIEMSTSVDDIDMMISVGGDGTFLDASHFVDDIPLLGVNSSKSSSFGHFCIGSKDNFAELLDKVISDELQPEKILRLDLNLNGTLLKQKVLNEILIAHTHPAATSRYLLSIDAVKEEQRSSGIWIGTPAGSTGSLRSAGGEIQPIIDNEFQYIVREPCVRPGEADKLLHGFLRRDQAMEVVSQMRTGAIFVDGQHIEYPFPMGDKLIVSASKNDLNAYVCPTVNDMFLTKQLVDADCKS